MKKNEGERDAEFLNCEVIKLMERLFSSALKDFISNESQTLCRFVYISIIFHEYNSLADGFTALRSIFFYFFLIHRLNNALHYDCHRNCNKNRYFN